jgi:hypothetical protein
MSDKHWKFLIFVYLSAAFLTSSLSLLWLMNGGLMTGWNGADWTGIREYLFYASAGSIGGTLYALRSFHQYYDKPIMTRFIYWYFMRPYMCGGTAMVLIVLLDSGIMLLQVDDSMTSRIGLSFLAGFGYGKVMEKLTYLTEALFNGNGQKDNGSSNGGDTNGRK